jgi:hypothetical protein
MVHLLKRQCAHENAMQNIRLAATNTIEIKLNDLFAGTWIPSNGRKDRGPPRPCFPNPLVEGSSPAAQNLLLSSPMSNPMLNELTST